jgi:hypothetical protein
MSSFALAKPHPRPSLIVFVALQTLDVLTTLIGLRIGASEGSMFIGNLMRVGPVAGLLISKIFATVLILVALKFRRPRVVVFLNYWSAAVVAWNLLMILMSGFRGIR